MKKICVSCAQIICKPGDLKYNLDRIEEFSKKASKVGARIILFGECSITGYLFTDDILNKALTENSDEIKRLLEISNKNNIVIAVGGIEKKYDDFYISHFVAFPYGKLVIQRKNIEPPIKLKNGRLLKGERERIIFDIEGVKFAILICADSNIPNIYSELKYKGCDIVLCPTAGGGSRRLMLHIEDLKIEDKIKKYIYRMRKVCFPGKAIERAIKYKMGIVAVNLAGDDGKERYHPGHCFIIDKNGKILSLFPGEYVIEFLEEKMIFGEIKLV